MTRGLALAALLLCCWGLTLAERLPWQTCWTSKTVAMLCCTPEAFVQHRDLVNASRCWSGRRSYPRCCEGDADGQVRTRVLVFSPPKTATRSLEELFGRMPDVVSRVTHSLSRAQSVHATMTPPCWVVAVARNPYHRNPSQFFHFATQKPPAYNVVGRKDRAAVDMSSGRWKTREEFLGESLQTIRGEFFHASRSYIMETAGSFFTDLGELLGFDFWAFVRDVAPVGRQPPSFLHRPSGPGSKCSMLVLNFERSDGWVPVLRRYFPSVRRINKTHVSADKWYSGKFREFMRTLVYSPYEATMMCQMDTMHLPFYRDRCQDCTQWGNQRLCSTIHP